jgi:hypothetical protein
MLFKDAVSSADNVWCRILRANGPQHTVRKGLEKHSLGVFENEEIRAKCRDRYPAARVVTKYHIIQLYQPATAIPT